MTNKGNGFDGSNGQVFIVSAARTPIGKFAGSLADIPAATLGGITERKAFGAPLSDQQGLRFMLAEMAQKVAAARALVRLAAETKDRGEDIAEASSLAKWTASDAAMSVTTDAVQLFGGAATRASSQSSG